MYIGSGPNVGQAADQQWQTAGYERPPVCSASSSHHAVSRIPVLHFNKSEWSKKQQLLTPLAHSVTRRAYIRHVPSWTLGCSSDYPD